MEERKVQQEAWARVGVEVVAVNVVGGWGRMEVEVCREAFDVVSEVEEKVEVVLEVDGEKERNTRRERHGKEEDDRGDEIEWMKREKREE